MGMNVAKEGGIEIFSAHEYLTTNDCWGVGGVLLHELAHAYHNKHCPDGFDCDRVKQVIWHNPTVLYVLHSVF